jgi:murein tripeptide amidase MpaA
VKVQTNRAPRPVGASQDRHNHRPGLRVVLVLALTLLLFVFLSAPAKAADDVHLVRVQIETKAQLVDIIGRHMDIAQIVPGEYVEIVAKQADIEYLTGKGYEVVMQVQDLASFYAERAMVDNGGFKTFAHIVAYLDTIHTAHPAITTAPFSIGTTLEGRTLWGIKISDNPDVDENEPEVFYNGMHHAREPIGPEVLLYFMDYLTDNYGSDQVATDIVNGRELYFVPVVNPDGYVYNETQSPSGGGMWRKNRKNNGDGTYGVDNNRNYGYQWGYDDVGSSPTTSHEDYRGTGPFSELENQHVRDYVESREFIITMNYHSHGNLLLYPWAYDRIYTPDHLYFKAVADSATSFNGYTPSVGWGLYPTNGEADDWGYGEQTTKGLVFSFTPEVGGSSDGFWPSPSRILPLCQENLPVNILMAQIADNPRRLGAPVAPTMLASTPVASGPFAVDWTHSDTFNPAAAFELVELTGKSTVTDDAESGPGLWATDGFTATGTRAHSGSASYYSGSGDDLHETMIASEHLEVAPADTLSLWCWYDIESNWDYAYVRASTDGGISFENLEGNITTTYDPNGQNGGHGITGSSGGWVEGRFPLDAYAGQQIIVQLAYVTDSYVVEEGIYCDDIGPLDTFSGSTVLSSSITNEYFTVAGRPPGIYHYKVRGVDVESQWGLWSDRGTVEVFETQVPALSTRSMILYGIAGWLLAVYLFRRRQNRLRRRETILSR